MGKEGRKRRGGVDTPLTGTIPSDAGVYELTVSMDLANLEGVCKKLEKDLTLSLTIEKADIELAFDRETAPGKTAGDLIDQINENYIVRYKNGAYAVSREILDLRDAGGNVDPDRKLPITIFVLDQDGTRQPMAETDRFDRTKDYVLTVGAVLLTENAAKNYELSLEDSYAITVGDRQKTEIRFERKEPGKDLIEVYEPGKSWSIADVTENLFTEEVRDTAGTVTKAGGAPAVFVQDENEEEGEYSVLLKDMVSEAEPQAAWYMRSSVEAGYVVDTEAGEILSENQEDGRTYVYKPVTSDPEDAGEYFIIWSYAGDDGTYESSHSEAVRFTIDPAPVVIRTSQESVDGAGFGDGMTEDDVRKALAKLSYDVYPLTKNETTGGMEIGSAAIETPQGFFGTSYRGDVESDAAQYFVPEFVLQRRVAKITEKGEAAAAVDPKAVEWETTESVKVTVDREKDGVAFDGIGETELPSGVEKEKLESVEFEFRVFFTGYKVIYDRSGNKVSEYDAVKNENVPVRVPITDVTTNAANRNYLADITKKTLEDTAVPVNVKPAESVQIVTDAIVEAFMTDNTDALYPQPGQDGADRDIHQGTLDKPAVKIYDRNALFKDRASYKQATVHRYGADGGIGEALSEIAPTDESLTYTWSYTTLEKYEEYLEQWDEVQRQYKDFEEYADLGWGWTDVAAGTLDSFRWAGFYRLTVTYDDPDHVYQSAKAHVFFKVERQEVVIEPTEKYAKAGENIAEWKETLGRKIGEDFVIYRLPHNSMEEFNALATEDAKKEYMLPTEEAAAEFEAENGHAPEMDLRDLEWEVQRKVKDSGTGQDTVEWITVDGGDSFDEDFTYGVVAHWTGNLTELEKGNVWENYTTKDVKTYRETGERKHHESVGAVTFYDRQLYVEIDAEKIKALGHEYDGNPVSLEEAAKAFTFYTDEALTESSRLQTEAIVNMTDEHDPAKIAIYWEKEEENAENGRVRYANRNAVYGGTYWPLLRFAGGGLGTMADTPEGAGVVTYAPLTGETVQYVNLSDGVDGSFTITPREITVTPMTMPADLLMAGGKADEILTNEVLLDDNIVEQDRKFFEYAEIAAGSFDVTWEGTDGEGTDKEGFAYPYHIDKDGGYPAFNGAARYVIQVDGREIRDPAEEYLRFGSTYTVKLTNELASPLKESYRVTYGTAQVPIEKRGNADVDGITDNAGQLSALSAHGVVYDFTEGVYTVKPRGAVRFYGENEPVNVIGRDGNEALRNTNILGFRIYAPKEFLNDFTAEKEKFVYRNEIWNAGGYFLNDAGWQEGVYEGELRQYIDVVFPLTKEDAERSFHITWEDGYTELFMLADIVPEEDLTKAVAPKSMAFNGVTGKMAVGEKQQLNLKITKAQLGDVIGIRYRIKGGGTKNEYISLDPEDGVVTALKAGKTATAVEAYAVYKDAKGNFVPILNNKGKEAKVASAKITVRDVTASTAKKITAQGNRAKLYFTVPDDGYRREIYLVDITKGTEYESRKKWKPADFNRAIEEMAAGGWENAGFAVQPVYSYAKNENLDDKEANGTYDKKLKAHIITIDHLEAEREYALYVRNVSAARALDDGSVVALSAGGTVRKFKTIKPQVQGLQLDFTIKIDEKDRKNTVTHPIKEDGTVDVYSYTVELSAKKAQLNVYGLFSDKEGGNDAADFGDWRRYSLVPTRKEEKDALKKYQMPKLEYAVLDDFAKEPFDPRLQPSKYAAVSKKGLISLKGVDLNGEKTVYIHVRDGMQHEDDFRTDAMIELTITAKPASMTGKKVKMKVGQAIRLSDYLEYKDAKKKKIPLYRSCGVTLTKEVIAEAEANGYRIEDRGEDELTHDWYITAVSPNRTRFDLAVTDFDADGTPIEAVVGLTSAKIDPVKGLKVTYVDDQNMTITFTHPSNLDEEDTGCVYDYALEIKDARGNVVDKIVLTEPNKVSDIDGVNAKELKRVQSWFQHVGTWVDESNPKHKTMVVDNASVLGFNYYTGTKTKTKTFAYTYPNRNRYKNPEQIQDLKLVRLSSYTISVTPLFENQKADKAAKTKTKTTNIPACPDDIDITGRGPDKLGGNLPILITSSGSQNRVDGGAAGAALDITAPYRLISGNTYTLEFVPVDAVAKDRVTDTLIWKSSNTKVASVKANAGTYTATFKAVNQGRTIISVTSKITKKVIARYAVTVYAVKDGSSYGGDYEPTWPGGFYEKILALYDPFYEGRLEVLSMNVPLVIQNKDDEGNVINQVRTWVSFTAPHYGRYTFNRNIDGFFDSRDGKRVGGGNTLFLEANQKVYFSVEGNGTLSVTGTELARLEKVHTKDAPLEVKAGYVSFTAWEDNVYTFWHNGKKLDVDGVIVDGGTGIGMKAGDTKFIQVEKDGRMYVTWREETAAEELKLGSHPTGTVTLDKDNQVRHISFTAGVAGVYRFTYQETEGVEVSFSAADGSALTETPDGEATDAAGQTVRRFKLKEGEKVVIAFRARPEITDAAKKFSMSVTVTAEQRRKLENASITVPKGTTEIIEYVIPPFTAEKVRFRFAVSGEADAKIVRLFNKDYHPFIQDVDALTVSKTSSIKPGDSIYIEVQAGGDADDKEAKDAVLTVTQVPADTLTAGSEKTREITNDTEQWYTFTAPGDGYYEFSVSVAERAENDRTPTHDARLGRSDELFGKLLEANITTKIFSMKTGEMIALRLIPGNVPDLEKEGATKEDGTKEESTWEVVKSTATVSVKALEIWPLLPGEQNAAVVQIPAKSREVRYYSFTAVTEDDYTISWQPADPKTDNAKVTYASSVTSQNGAQTVAANGSSVKLKTGDVRYIRVEIDERESGDAVNGKLCVTAANLNADALTAGTAYPFRLEDKDGRGDRKVVKFTAPVSGNYAIVTTVKENPVSGLPYEYPEIYTYPDGEAIGMPSGSVTFRKGETRYFTLSFKPDQEEEVRETEGTVTVRSLAEPLTGEQTDVSVAKDVVKEYTYTIPESGRYGFKADYDEEKASVVWYDTDGGDDDELADGDYCRKNTKVKATVTGLDGEADASVKLYRPALISTTALNTGVNSIAVNAGETRYYELNAGSEPKIYDFEVSEITGTATVHMQYAVGHGNDWKRLSDGSVVSMSGDSKMTVKIQSGSEKKGISCRLTVTERKELALGGNAVHLDAGASVYLAYRAPETGYYGFQVQEPGKELTLATYKNESWVTQIGDSFYDIAGLNAKGIRTYILTNEGSGAVDLTVTMSAVKPIALAPGGKTEAVTIPADGEAYFALKTFKKAAYLIKIADTSKGADLDTELFAEEVDSYDEKKTTDGISIEAQLGGESALRIANVGLKETAVTVELVMSETQPLPDGAVTIAKSESRLFSFVAAEDARYLITKDNEDVQMTLVSRQNISDGTTDYPDTAVDAYGEELLRKGDKLVYRLSYEPDPEEEKAKESQTVNVKIAKIVPKTIEAEATPVTLAQKDNRSVWYQFTVAEDAVYTFTLEDTYGNEVPDRMAFYRYFADSDEVGQVDTERHMKAGRKVYIHVDYPDEGSYTLKYRTLEAITETGARTLDFGYQDEVQEVKFVVPKGGTYKVSATAVRGRFAVAGKIGNRTVVDEFKTNDGRTSRFLMKDDIVTFTVTAVENGKSSVTLRIAEDNMADTLTLGKEYAGVSDTGKVTYHELRIGKKALYAITAGGEPEVRYAVNDNPAVNDDGTDSAFKLINGVVYRELDQDDRIVIKVEGTDAEKAYTVKVEEVSVTSLDGKNKEEEPYSVSAGENYYGFTTAEAYVRFKAPADGKYYIAVQTVNDNTVCDGIDIAAPDQPTTPDQPASSAAKAILYQPEIRTLAKDQTVTLTFTNDRPKDEEDPSVEYRQAVFKLTIQKMEDDENPITLGETKSDSLAPQETVCYQFKAAEAGKYVIGFSGSNCALDEASDGDVIKLEKDGLQTLTVVNDSYSKAGSYRLTVTKLSPEVLTLGATAQKTLKKGEKAYYEFASTETTEDGETMYQVYVSGEDVWYTCYKVDAEGKEFYEDSNYTGYHHEVALKKGEKLAFTVENDSDMTHGYWLTVKKVEYSPVKADTPVPGSLEAYESAYYEFTSEDTSEDGATYQVSAAGSDSVEIWRIRQALWETDSEGKDLLGTPEDVSDQNEFTLKKGEKLLMTATNYSIKAAQFELTVEKTEEAAVTYQTIALDEKKTGKLAEDETAGYEFTAGDAAEEGTPYSVYFVGGTCSYSRTTTEKDADGKTEEKVISGSLHSGSNEFTWGKGDKIRFTVSGTGKYELTVRKVAYAPLTAGTTVSKTLGAGETAYYQFTSKDEPMTGETETKYQVYGSFYGYTVRTRTVTVGEDGSTTETGWNNRSSEYDLEKGQILQFQVTGQSPADPFRLTIKKVQYSPMTLGTAVEGRVDLAENGYAYYEFLSQDDPTEGQTTTEYQVFGTATYYYSEVTVKEDETLTTSGWYYRSGAMKLNLAKGQRLRFRITGPGKSEEGYNLTVAKTEEKAVVVGSKTETGSLGVGQELVYTLKHEEDTPATYTLRYEKTAKVSVSVSGATAKDKDNQRIQMSQGDTLRITVTAIEETDNFAFTLGKFSPEILTLDKMTDLKKLALNETVYYQYTAGEESSYVLSMVASKSDRLEVSYEVSRADSLVMTGMVNEGVGEIALRKDDVLLVKVTAPNQKAAAAYSCRLLLQKKTVEESMTALPWNGTLQPGEVKYFKFSVPEAEETEKADSLKYAYSITYTSGKMKYEYNGVNISVGLNDIYCGETTDGFVLRAANISMYSAAECSIDVQESPYIDLGGNGIEGTVAKGETAYYRYTPDLEGDYLLDYERDYVLDCTGDARIQYSTDRTATKSWLSIPGTGKKTVTLAEKEKTIYLKISHTGAEETADYKVTIKEAEYTGFRLRASRKAVCIGSDTLYLYLDTDIRADQIAVSYGPKGSAEEQQITLYDDGSAEHGDDMKGDGTYSIVIHPTGSEDTEMSFTARYGVKKSTVTVRYYTPLSDDIFSTMDDVDGEIENLLSASDFTEKEDSEKLEMVTGLLNGLMEEDKILEDSLHIDEENTLVSFQYPGEILGGVMYGEFEEEFNGALDGEWNGAEETDTSDGKGEEERGKTYPERNTYVPPSYDVTDTQQSQEIGRAVILNSFPSFETSQGMIAYRTEFYETLKTEWEEAGLKTVLDTDVTVDDYKDLQKYNVVCISTHGSLYTTGGVQYPAICLSEPQSAGNNRKYMTELKNKQIAKVNGSYWILPSFFAGQYGDEALDDTFIFSECCMAMGAGADNNQRMAQAFTGRGAKAYIGFHNSVYASYSREFMKEYVESLMAGTTSGQAYDAAVAKHGAHDGGNAYPVHNGDRNAVLVNAGLLNGGFEDYNASTTAPKTWACMGDVRTLAQLGDIMPYGGDSARMAMITTGIGAKENAEFEGGTEGSMLSQTFRVPDGVSKLRFDYNFVSEEPMEFVGSQFDDNFGIRISEGGNPVLKKTYESVNTSEWKAVEGINFAGGDDTVFHTDWKTAEVDVSGYCGNVITLSFIIYDVGDQIYDSACVIDNVVLQ